MELTETALLEKLKANWPLPRKCSICGEEGGKWQLLPQLYELAPIHTAASIGLGMGASANIVPIVIAACSKCGNLHLFGAVKLGIIDPATGSLVTIPVEPEAAE